jgi:hypothetical protein
LEEEYGGRHFPFLSAWIIVVEANLCIPVAGELDLWSTITMGQPNRLQPKVSAHETPQQFGVRISQTQLLFQSRSKDRFNERTTLTAVDIFIRGVPETYREAMRWELNRIDVNSVGLIQQLGHLSIKCNTLHSNALRQRPAAAEPYTPDTPPTREQVGWNEVEMLEGCNEDGKDCGGYEELEAGAEEEDDTGTMDYSCEEAAEQSSWEEAEQQQQQQQQGHQFQQHYQVCIGGAGLRSTRPRSYSGSQDDGDSRSSGTGRSAGSRRRKKRRFPCEFCDSWSHPTYQCPNRAEVRRMAGLPPEPGARPRPEEEQP